MHPALCIDEVLQLIFDFCGDLRDSEPKWTYGQLARCCKTWTDPALDRLWRRMGGLKPLLALLPKSDECIAEATPTVEDYAKRVRHVVYADGFVSVPSLKLSEEHGPNVFPHLESVSLVNAGCLAPPAWIHSPFLTRVAVNLSFSRKPHSVFDRSAAVARFLPTVPQLHTLQLRGRMSVTLNAVLASLTQLRSLTVHTGDSLGCDTLAAIATFPALRILEVHASHIDADELKDTFAMGDAAFFPALEEQSIRTNAPLLATLLAHIPSGVLRKLSLDIDGDGDANQAALEARMKPVFELLAQKAAGSLHDLLIEDRTVHDEEQDGNHARGYALDVLSPLARVRQLRSFILREPDLFDKDLETMARWWPVLERLDLGTPEGCGAPEESDEMQADEEHGQAAVAQAMSQMTSEAYRIVARSFRFLESLSLGAIAPCEVVPVEERTKFVTQLRCLTVGKASDVTGKVDAPAVVAALLSIFPTVTSIDCPDAEVSARFEVAVAGGRR
ncbi:hypothetical protein GSI_12558 [Ganoderma sinense ZZ0214-1]|uniref:F-box domain-containing protein n=1 Tax=Ganoderma sinense ZZ0214-1 TaxID=1077348 RepID=A0A2G8RT64_9APHY|nr:hypothetical protein GSI_12558 [Ganoderma sinense ZZ0214-1]